MKKCLLSGIFVGLLAVGLVTAFSFVGAPATLIQQADISAVGEDVEGDFITSDGARIHYWFYNRGTPTVTLFLHGGPGHGTEDFRAWQANAYARAFGSLLVFDQRGSGESDKRIAFADTITFDRSLQDINELRGYVIPNTPVIVYGRSFGGLLAAHYADAHPNMVKGYILVAPGQFDYPNAEAQRAALQRTLGEKNIGFALNNDYERIYARMPETPDPVIDQDAEFRKEQAKELTDLNYLVSSEKGMPSLLENNYALLTSMQNIPTVIVYGTHDFMVPPAAIEAMRPYLPNATFVSLPGSHLAAYAQQDEFFRAVSLFFERL